MVYTSYKVYGVFIVIRVNFKVYRVFMVIRVNFKVYRVKNPQSYTLITPLIKGFWG